MIIEYAILMLPSLQNFPNQNWSFSKTFAVISDKVLCLGPSCDSLGEACTLIFIRQSSLLLEMPGLPSDVSMVTSRSRDQQSMAQTFSSSGIGSQTSHSGFLSNVSQQRYIHLALYLLYALLGCFVVICSICNCSNSLCDVPLVS